MKREIVSLTALFLRNTFAHMKFGSVEKMINAFENNIEEEMNTLFCQIIKLLKQKSTVDSSKNTVFLSKWEKFKSEKWGYDCLVCLREIKKYLERVDNEVLLKSYLQIVENYYKNEWPQKSNELNYKFSKSHVKKYKDYTEYTELKSDKIDMLTDGFIVSFFKKNKGLYDNYIKWMQKTENFFEYVNQKSKIKFEYKEEEYNKIKECVNNYVEFQEFNEQSFCDFLKELLYILEGISSSRLNDDTVCDENLENIRNDIRKIYNDLLLVFVETIGMAKEEKDDMLWMSTNDVIESYKFAKQIKNITWAQCTENRGFMACMCYRIYSYLSKKNDNEFLKSYVKAMVKKNEEDYGVYINEAAQIDNRVWIDEKCKIGKCKIENDVIILSEVEIMADNLIIHSGSTIGPKACITNRVGKK